MSRSRSRAGLACSLVLLSLAGCAGAGVRPSATVPRMAAVPERPARKSSWLGGLIARPSRSNPPTEPGPAAPAGAGSSAPASESTLARFFPGLPRSNGAGRASAGVSTPATPAPALAAARTASPSPGPGMASGREDVPLLPVALNVEVHPDVEMERLASHEVAGEPLPLIEARPESAEPEPEPIIKARAEIPADEPAPVVEARVENADEPVAAEVGPSAAAAPEPVSRAAAEEAPPREPEVSEPLPNLEELADAAPAPAPPVASSQPMPAPPTPPSSREFEPLPRLEDLIDPELATASRSESLPPEPDPKPAGRPRITRPRPVPPPPISRAEQANLLFPRSYYEPGELAPIEPPPEEPTAPVTAPATPRQPGRLRRWLGRSKAASPPAAASRVEPGDDVAQGG